MTSLRLCKVPEPHEMTITPSSTCASLDKKLCTPLEMIQRLQREGRKPKREGASEPEAKGPRSLTLRPGREYLRGAPLAAVLLGAEEGEPNCC